MSFWFPLKWNTKKFAWTQSWLQILSPTNHSHFLIPHLSEKLLKILGTSFKFYFYPQVLMDFTLGDKLMTLKTIYATFLPLNEVRQEETLALSIIFKPASTNSTFILYFNFFNMTEFSSPDNNDFAWWLIIAAKYSLFHSNEKGGMATRFMHHYHAKVLNTYGTYVLAVFIFSCICFRNPKSSQCKRGVTLSNLLACNLAIHSLHQIPFKFVSISYGPKRKGLMCLDNPPFPNCFP